MRSVRLNAIADYIDGNDTVLDIGTDHGYLPKILRSRYPEMKIGASDIAEGPLRICAETFRKYGISDIQLYLSDGVKSIADRYSCTVIAGMGGETIVRILKDGEEYFRNVRKMILSPNSEAEKVRKYLGENRYILRKESMIRDYKYYVILQAEPCGDPVFYTDEECEFGPVLMKSDDPTFRAYWEKELRKAENILENLSSGHPDAEKLQQKIRKIRQVLHI